MSNEVKVDSTWEKRYVRFSDAFYIFFPIWFTVVFFIGAHIWMRIETAPVRAQVEAMTQTQSQSDLDYQRALEQLNAIDRQLNQ